MEKVDWRENTLCLNLGDTELFFDKYEEDTDLRANVDKLCQMCPVRKQCLTEGIARKAWGVWGGIYLEDGQISRQFNNHKSQADWFTAWQALTMETS